MLEVRGLSVSYGKHRALEDVSLRVDPGEIVVILGANGAGKSTLLRAIGGICQGRHTGMIEMDGHPIHGLSANKIVEHGLALVPEGRGIFGDLTVAENLTLGAYAERAREDETANLDRVLALFPRLAERKRQIARTMSGGEQQMVAIGRAMMSNPRVLMLDEPSLGLSPLLCKELFANLRAVRETGISILLVEQNARQSLAIADRGYLLENAHIVHEDSAANLMRDPAVQKAYLGAAGTAGARRAEPRPAAKAAAPVPAAAVVAKPAGPTPNDIAAQALASFSGRTAGSPAPPPAAPEKPRSVPRMPAVSAAPPPRRSADELAGAAIADLVARATGTPVRPAPAAKPAAPATPPRPPTAPPASPRYAPQPQPMLEGGASHDDRLRAMLEGMEKAAENARRRPNR
jgi:branched-chain amino acid transport system ATP-binding protein